MVFSFFFFFDSSESLFSGSFSAWVSTYRFSPFSWTHRYVPDGKTLIHGCVYPAGLSLLICVNPQIVAKVFFQPIVAANRSNCIESSDKKTPSSYDGMHLLRPRKKEKSYPKMNNNGSCRLRCFRFRRYQQSKAHHDDDGSLGRILFYKHMEKPTPLGPCNLGVSRRGMC